LASSLLAMLMLGIALGARVLHPLLALTS